MTMDSIPKLFSQLRDVFPELEPHSYFELDPDVKDLLSKFQGSDPFVRKIEAWSFVPRRLIWALVGARQSLSRYPGLMQFGADLHPDSRFSHFRRPFCIMPFHEKYLSRSTSPGYANLLQCHSVVSRESEWAKENSFEK